MVDIKSTVRCRGWVRVGECATPAATAGVASAEASVACGGHVRQDGRVGMIFWAAMISERYMNGRLEAWRVREGRFWRIPPRSASRRQSSWPRWKLILWIAQGHLAAWICYRECRGMAARVARKLQSRTENWDPAAFLAECRDRWYGLLQHPLRGQDSAAFLDSSGATSVIGPARELVEFI